MCPTDVQIGWMDAWHIEFNFNHRINGYPKWLVMQGPYIWGGSDWLLGAWRIKRRLTPSART